MPPRRLVLAWALACTCVARADDAPDAPKAHFASEAEWAKSFVVPENGWALADEAEVHEARRYIFQKVCQDTVRDSRRTIFLLKLSSSKGVQLAQVTGYVSSLGLNNASALHCAAFHGRPDFVEELLHAGADWSARATAHDSGDSFTPLHLIVQEALRIAGAEGGSGGEGREAKAEGLRDAARWLLALSAHEDAAVHDQARLLSQEGWDALAASVGAHAKDAGEPPEEGEDDLIVNDVKTEL